jgi:eukaryotic-like serine/threonine-protein kinase
VLEPGSIFIGKYKIERVLGQGGMGVVFAATHIELADRVAIKLLHPEMAVRPDVVDRFLREAQASVRLKGEHVARISDVGRTSDGVPYIVMEHLEGCDLMTMFRSRGKLPPGEVADYILQTCEAMAEAHAQAIVHRDIKPANLFVASRPDGSPVIKVLDFGISKALDRDLQLTSSQAMLGTPAYMSPEQLRASRDVDTRTDVWSLGVVMYELLAGAQPFDASSFGDLVLQVVTEPARPLVGHDLPRGLAAVVARCLERDPRARFQSVAELAAAVAPFAMNRSAAASAVERTHNILRRAGTMTPLPHVALEPYVSTATTEMTSNGAVHAVASVATPRSRARGWIAACFAMAVVAAFAVVALTRSSSDAPVPSTAPRPEPSVAIDAAVVARPSSPPIDAAAPAIAIVVDAGVVAPPVDAAPKRRPGTVHRPPPPVDPLGTRY